LRHVEDLQEMIDAVKKAGNGSNVYVSQHETSRSAVTLGDEDTEAGTRLRVAILLENKLYYSEEFFDDLLYEETIETIKELKNMANVKMVSEDEIEKMKSGK